MPEKEQKELTPEQIAEQRKIADERAIEEVKLNPQDAPDALTRSAIIRQNLTDDQKDSLKIENAIHNAYADGIQKTTDLVNTLTQKKKDAQLQDATAQRKARSMQMVAGISDGLANLANLMGVGGIGNIGGMGNNIDLGGGALTPLQQKMEAARLERKADIKSIDDRLDQANNQLLQMKLARGGALASAVQKDIEAKRAAEAAAAKRANELNLKMLDIQAKGALQEDQQAHDAEMKKKQNETTIRSAQIKAGQSGDKTKPDQYILTTEDGGQIRYDVDAKTNDAILNNFASAIEADLATDTSSDEVPSEFRKAYNNYSDLSSKVGLGLATKEQAEDAKKRLIQASPTLRANIERHGKKAGKWSAFEQ